MLFSHVTVGTNDIKKAKIFYDAIFKVIGTDDIIEMENRLIYKQDGQFFMVVKPIDGNKATYANGGTIGLNMDSVEQVNQWHQAGMAQGGQAIESPPGVREMGDIKLYLAYLRDPDGNKLCGYYLIK